MAPPTEWVHRSVMADSWAPIVVAVVAGLVAWLLLVVVPRLVTRRRATSRIDLDGLPPDPVLFFTDPVCASCREARAALEELGVEYREVRYDADPDRFAAAGVISVPLIVVRRSGTVRMAAGVPSQRRLRRLMG